VMPGVAPDDARAVGEEMCRNVEQLGNTHSGSTVGSVTTISVGCASLIPHRGDTLVALISTADAALYDAKHQGKNRTVARLAANAPAPDSDAPG